MKAAAPSKDYPNSFYIITCLEDVMQNKPLQKDPLEASIVDRAIQIK